MAQQDEPFSSRNIDEQIERLLAQSPQSIPPTTASARLVRLLRRLYRQQATTRRARALADAWQRITQEAARRATPPDGALRQETAQGMLSPNRAGVIYPSPKGASFMNTRQVRGLTALVTLVAVVAIFVLLFSVILPRHAASPRVGSAGTPQPTKTPTATPIPLPAGQWTPLLSVGVNDGDIPTVMLAPENPNIIYESSTPSGTDTILILRRTTDGGKTWHALAVPNGLPAAFDTASIAVSPLDPNVVILTLTIYEGAHPGACQSASTGSSNALVRFSGGPSCGAQFYSADGGQSWSRLTLPIAGALGATNVNVSNPTSEDVLRPQGQRLYSAVDSSTVDNVTFGGPGARILASDDGGATWKLVDAEVNASGQNICDYAPTPTGSTIFAITQEGACYDANSAPTDQFFWRSDDAGVHWTQVSKLPSQTRQITVADLGSGAGSVLYLQLLTSTAPAFSLTPTPTPGPVDQGDTDILFSTNGGKTWQNAPASGIASHGGDSAYPSTPTGPIATLSDGSVVAAFPTRQQSFIFAAWKPGNSAWRPITPALAGITMLDSFFTTSGSAGTPLFWAIGQSADNTTNVFRYG